MEDLSQKKELRGRVSTHCVAAAQSDDVVSVPTFCLRRVFPPRIRVRAMAVVTSPILAPILLRRISERPRRRVFPYKADKAEIRAGLKKVCGYAILDTWC